MELIAWFKLQWDRVLGIGLMLLGVVLLVAGWVGASGEVFVANQVPYVLSGGMGGLATLVLGATLWLSADLSDEWRTLDRIDAVGAHGGDAALEERVRELELRLASLDGSHVGPVRHAAAAEVR